jgi:hypothetical protein
MRLDPSHAMFKFADQNAMSDSDEWYSDHNLSRRGSAVLVVLNRLCGTNQRQRMACDDDLLIRRNHIGRPL